MEYPLTHCSDSQRAGRFRLRVCACVCGYVCVRTLSRQDIGADIWEINTRISLCLTLYTQSDSPLLRKEKKGGEGEKGSVNDN